MSAPVKLAFERRYSDNSGVEFAVRYDATALEDHIEFERLHTAAFPVDELEWLIDCLTYIRQTINGDAL